MEETKPRVITIVTEDGRESMLERHMRRTKTYKAVARRNFLELREIKKGSTVGKGRNRTYSILMALLLMLVFIQFYIIWLLS
jgi:hypothetical protein